MSRYHITINGKPKCLCAEADSVAPCSSDRPTEVIDAANVIRALLPLAEVVVKPGDCPTYDAGEW